MSSTPTPAPAASPSVPATFSSANFTVQLGSGAVTPVSAVAGIEVDIAVADVREGSNPSSPQKEPGQISYANLVLTRALTTNPTFWTWVQEVLAGTPSEQNISVTLLDSQLAPVIRWNFRNAFPVKWTGPALNALSSEIAIETLEIAHSGFEMILL